MLATAAVAIWRPNPARKSVKDRSSFEKTLKRMLSEAPEKTLHLKEIRERAGIFSEDRPKAANNYLRSCLRNIKAQKVAGAGPERWKL
jgi:hypothetical protein